MATATATSASSPPHLKVTYRPETKVEQFYAGGGVSLSYDASLLVTSCEEDVKFVRIETGRVEHTLKTGDVVTSLALHPHRLELITASRNQLLKQWVVEDGGGTVRRQWKAHDLAVVDMAFDATGTMLATGSADRTVKIFDVENGYCTHNFRGHEEVVKVVCFHPDSQHMKVVSGGEEGAVRVWDLQTKRCVLLSSHLGAVTSLAFTNDGSRLVSGGHDKVLSVWDMCTYALLRTIPVFEAIEVVRALPGGLWPHETRDIVVIGGEKGLVRAWDIETGDCTATQPDHDHTIQLTNIEIAPHTKHGVMCCVTADHSFFLRSLSSLERTRTLMGHLDEIIDIKYMPGRADVVAIATNSDQVQLLNLVTRNCDLLWGHSNIVISVDVSLDGVWLASSSKDNTVRVWNVEEKSCAMVCVGHTDDVGCVVWSRRTASFLVTGSSDKTIKLWDVSPITAPKRARGHQDNNARFTTRAHEKDINSVAVSPNDKMIATGSQDKTVKLWNTSDLSLLGEMRGHRRGIWCVEFSPVDKVLASSSSDRTIKIWSLKDFSCLKTFEGHTNSVLRVAFLTSGMQLISSGGDGVVKLWTIKTNECVNTFDEHEDKIWALAVRPDQGEILTGGSDSLLCIWRDVTIEEEETRTQKAQDLILKEQDLQNLLREKEYSKAARIAFELDEPFRLLGVLEELLLPENEDALDALVRSFSQEELAKCLRFARDWNTSIKHSLVAQRVLNAVFRCVSPSTITSCANIRELLVGLIPYTERHLDRLRRLHQSSFFIDFTLQSMKRLIAAPIQEGFVAATSAPIQCDPPAAMDTQPQVPDSSDKRPEEDGWSEEEEEEEEEDEDDAQATRQTKNKRKVSMPSTRSQAKKKASRRRSHV